MRSRRPRDEILTRFHHDVLEELKWDSRVDEPGA
jgi:hypothetical protein